MTSQETKYKQAFCEIFIDGGDLSEGVLRNPSHPNADLDEEFYHTVREHPGYHEPDVLDDENLQRMVMGLNTSPAYDADPRKLKWTLGANLRPYEPPRNEGVVITHATMDKRRDAEIALRFRRTATDEVEPKPHIRGIRRNRIANIRRCL